MTIRELIEYGCDEAGCPELATRIRVEWNNRFTRKGGDARYLDKTREGRIRLSAKLWPTMSEDKQTDLVLHELAHVIDVYKHGYAVTRAKGGHGYSWRQIAQQIGAQPQRYMKESDANFAMYRRKVTRYSYICKGCGKELSLTQNLVTRMQRGRSYCCMRCRTRIEV